MLCKIYAALIAVGMIVGAKAIGDKVDGKFSEIATTIDTAGDE